MIEFIISFAIYWAIFSVGIMAGRKKGQMEEREACYKWIAFGILSTRSNIPPFIIQRFKKERFAETRKAKIRLSNIKIEEFTQVLKGLSKPIK